MVTFSNKVYSKAKRYLLKSYLGLAIFRSLNRKKENFICPICSYHGPFVNVHPETGIRKHALCPKCGSAERHRLQYLVLRKIAVTYDLSKMSLIHFAPESFFQRYFRKVFGSYTSADLYNRNVDYKIDLRNIPFEDHSYDVVFASHVLEHIKEDDEALKNMFTLLKKHGKLILLVPAHKILFSDFDKLLGHWRRYDKKLLGRKLSSVGLKRVLLRYINFSSAFGWLIFLKFTKWREIPKKQLGIFDFFGKIFLWPENFIEPPFGLSVLAIYEK